MYSLRHHHSLVIIIGKDYLGVRAYFIWTVYLAIPSIRLRPIGCASLVPQALAGLLFSAQFCIEIMMKIPTV